MKKCAEKNKLFKEQPFVLGLPQNEELILVQGIIDVYFEEDDTVVLMDYKTDKVESEETLIGRYQIQLDYYAEVLQKLLSKPVKDIVIYSFYLEKEIIFYVSVSDS